MPDPMLTNAILRQLPEDEFDRLRGMGEVVDTEIGRQVYETDQPIREVLFPLNAVFSLVALADQRILVEVATVGREGMVGLPLFLGASSSPHAAFCQIPGQAMRVPAANLHHALTGDGALHALLHRLTQATMVQVAQNVVCNSTHGLEQRAARWLLTTHDRVDGDRYPLTQEFLAQMLGVRRPTVSQVASRLQDAGLVRYARGDMRILDRSGLEKTACNCYGIVRAEFDAMAHGG